jgi:hypothetical protein
MSCTTLRGETGQSMGDGSYTLWPTPRASMLAYGCFYGLDYLVPLWSGLCVCLCLLLIHSWATIRGIWFPVTSTLSTPIRMHGQVRIWQVQGTRVESTFVASGYVGGQPTKLPGGAWPKLDKQVCDSPSSCDSCLFSRVCLRTCAFPALALVKSRVASPLSNVMAQSTCSGPCMPCIPGHVRAVQE